MEATIIGCALVLGGQGLLTWGEQYLSSSVTALLFSTVPIWVLLLGKIVYREKLKKFTAIGVIRRLCYIDISFSGSTICRNRFS
jgi:drug/metabolite transporter (DMT)-like permease